MWIIYIVSEELIVSIPTSIWSDSAGCKETIISFGQIIHEMDWVAANENGRVM